MTIAERRDYNKKYTRSKKGKRRQRKAERAFYYRNINKRYAKRRVQTAVTNGDLAPLADRWCVDCLHEGIQTDAENYHHPSYERVDWLKVVPLCRRCHYARHGKVMA